MIMLICDSCTLAEIRTGYRVNTCNLQFFSVACSYELTVRTNIREIQDKNTNMRPHVSNLHLIFLILMPSGGSIGNIRVEYDGDIMGHSGKQSTQQLSPPKLD